jgi:hypothetical protein
LVEYFQKWLEEKNKDGKLLDWLYGNDHDRRNDTDTKLLLLVWLNNHIYFNSIDKKLLSEIDYLFNGKNPSQIIKYAHSMVSRNWNDEILKHNLGLFKTL